MDLSYNRGIHTTTVSNLHSYSVGMKSPSIGLIFRNKCHKSTNGWLIKSGKSYTSEKFGMVVITLSFLEPLKIIIINK